MTDTAPINPKEFVEQVQPLLESQDLPGLLSLLQTKWSKEQLQDLLSSQHVDARKVACLALGYVGKRCCVPTLAMQLQDPDPTLNEMAEHALWSIWFRCGSPEANQLLAAGAAAMGDRDVERAEELFTEAIHVDPSFAEAYNQRAIVHYLAERYEPSIADCREAVKCMPCHFGALAGMGHGHAHLGKISKAIQCYEKALRINPHLKCVRQAVEALRKQEG